jgi:hypothetical protein
MILLSPLEKLFPYNTFILFLAVLLVFAGYLVSS